MSEVHASAPVSGRGQAVNRPPLTERPAARNGAMRLANRPLPLLATTRVYACGITPYPSPGHGGRADPRRGPVAARADRELRKTALAAVDSVRVEHVPAGLEVISRLQSQGVTVLAVEIAPAAQSLWQSPLLAAEPLALVFGHETESLSAEVLTLVDATICLPMRGAGKSLNVATAVAVVLYEVLRRQSRTP